MKLLVSALWVIIGLSLAGQEYHPIVAHLGRSGTLIAGNLRPGTEAGIEWAPTPEGPWTNTWDHLNAITVGENGVILVKVPMFYRVRGVPSYPDSEKYAWVPAGNFTMGSPPTEQDRTSLEGPQTEVTITQGFWISRYEVTQQEYLDVTGSNPSWFNGLRPESPRDTLPAGDFGIDLSRPVENINYQEALDFCVLLNEREQEAGRLPDGYIYRLPTEAEWEYACRAGTTTRFYYGDDPGYSLLNSFAWNYQNGQGRTHVVGQLSPNAWGLHDMHGNVHEWCHDWRSGSLPGGSVIDPVGPCEGSDRIHRGGTWFEDGGEWLRTAVRPGSPPDLRTGTTGMRIVLARPIP